MKKNGNKNEISDGVSAVLLNTAKNTRDPFAIRVRVRAACLSSVIAIVSLEAK